MCGHTAALPDSMAERLTSPFLSEPTCPAKSHISKKSLKLSRRSIANFVSET
jgi:hypothetical protein